MLARGARAARAHGASDRFDRDRGRANLGGPAVHDEAARRADQRRGAGSRPCAIDDDSRRATRHAPNADVVRSSAGATVRRIHSARASCEVVQIVFHDDRRDRARHSDHPRVHAAVRSTDRPSWHRHPGGRPESARAHRAGGRSGRDRSRAHLRVAALPNEADGRTAGALPEWHAAAPMPSVLIVDDEPNIRRMVGALLGAEGYEVRDAQDGASGLAARDSRASRTCCCST